MAGDDHPTTTPAGDLRAGHCDDAAGPLGGLVSGLTDPDQRAEYQGAAHIGHTAGSVWAPALLTWWAVEHGSTGWLVIAAIVLVATATMRTTSRSAERYLERTAAPR